MRYTSLAIAGASLFLAGSAYLVSHYIEVAHLKAQDAPLELLISASPNPSPDITPSVTPPSSPPATVNPGGGGGGGFIPIQPGGDYSQPIRVEVMSNDGTEVNARFGPGTKFGIAESYSNGTVVFLTGRRHPSGWLELVNGYWVRETLVVRRRIITESQPNLPRISPPPTSRETEAACIIENAPELTKRIVAVDEQTILQLTVTAPTMNSCKVSIALPPSISAAPAETTKSLTKDSPTKLITWLLTPQKLGQFSLLVDVGGQGTTLQLEVRDAFGLTIWQTKLIAGIAALLGGGIFTVGLTLNPRK